MIRNFFHILFTFALTFQFMKQYRLNPQPWILLGILLSLLTSNVFHYDQENPMLVSQLHIVPNIYNLADVKLVH